MKELPTAVFNRPTAVKWVRHMTKHEPPSDAIAALLKPGGTVVGMFAFGTGRKVPGSVARKARELMNELLPDIRVRKRPRRTSRPNPRRSSRRRGPRRGSARGRRRTSRPRRRRSSRRG